jgi:hypothetical protein
MSDIRKDQMKEAVLYFLNRLNEPSTWAGLGFIFMAYGVTQNMSIHHASIGMLIAGAASVFLKEKSQDRARRLLRKSRGGPSYKEQT